MKIKELSHGIIYIEDAFPKHKEFIEAIENPDNISSTIPEWSDWVNSQNSKQGSMKEIDWDYSVNNKNAHWPRVKVNKDKNKVRSKAYDILNMIHEPLLESLEVWYEKTGIKKLDWISRNYTIKKYDPGKGIHSHPDRNKDDKTHTFDWTALVYLNDDYTGGELYFDDLDIILSPSAGSILFFSTDELHTAKKVLTGNKYFLFFYIHSEFGIMHGMKEQSAHLVNLILSGNKKKSLSV
jgi:predicted 2-oxoglutarate/Fe(II)-dependent dioxygenase YbiX